MYNKIALIAEYRPLRAEQSSSSGGQSSNTSQPIPPDVLKDLKEVAERRKKRLKHEDRISLELAPIPILMILRIQRGFIRLYQGFNRQR